MIVNIVCEDGSQAQMKPGDRLDLVGHGHIVYYTEEESVHVRGLLEIRQRQTREVIAHVEARMRKGLGPSQN